MADAVTGIAEIAKQGVLGALAAVLFAGLAWMTKAWKSALEDRIQDAKAYAEALREQNNAATALVVETNRSNDGLKAAFGRMETETAQRLSNREQIEKEIGRSLDALREKQQELLPEVRQAIHSQQNRNR